uniref:Uncharacterized protein n=1 Tax=Cyclophora tenuis TaxID=216820 RepID=A0A7S1DAR6_CYCTE|mmetsp:Transcript_7028/g.12226  ORF Transcript_7028/g.12226 Transcript_7028/m.12226 type:complete len:254 (+) Transcript_7028:1-762(+)
MCARMTEFNVQHILLFTLPLWQISLNLLDRSDRIAVLTGEAMDEEEFMREAQRRKNSIALHIVRANKLSLGTMFEQWSMLKELLPIMEREKDVIDVHFSQPFMLLALGTAHLCLYIATGRTYYHRRAKRVIRRFQKWSNWGVPNAETFLMILRAQVVGMTESYEAAKKAFIEAIERCSLTEGFFQICQIAKKLAGDCMLRYGKINDAQDFLSDFRDHCIQWENIAMVNFLERKYSHILAAARCCSEDTDYRNM